MDAKSIETNCSRDAISGLPDDVLGKILSLLPTEQAASTSVLAKRWRNVFRLVDNLHFDDSVWGVEKLERDMTGVLLESTSNFVELNGFVAVEQELASYMFPESFKNFVERILVLQGDYPIKKFSLKCHVGNQKACVERWISNVVERGVLELDLRIRDERIHFLPSQLFASKTLVKLTLGTELKLGKLPSDVSLPSLKTLFLDTVFFFQKEDFCGVLLAGCTVLEELSVHHYDFKGTPLTISSPTVKRLSINFRFCDDRGELSLNLPNLVYLDYSDFALAEYPQVNLESLVEAKLDLRPVGYKWTAVLTDLLLGIKNVKILHLSPISVDVIAGSVKHDGLLLPVFNNLLSLSFGSKHKRGWKFLPYLLKQSPNLETLIIQDLNCYICDVVSMPRNNVKMLHILSYRETAQALKQLKIFVGEFKCLEAVQVDAVKTGDVLQTKKDLMMLLGVSLPPKCLFKVT